MSFIFHFLLKKDVFVGVSPMPIFTRRLSQIQDTFHFTSYWRYCFLHSGVMWDERCSANFILPVQLSPQTSVKSESGCPLPRRRDFCYFSQLAGSTCGASARRTTAPLHSTSRSSRSVHSGQIPSHILFHGRDGDGSGPSLTGGRAAV